MASDRPQHSDDWLTVYQGDWIDVLRTLPAESVHCVVTSPPYWGLRDYGQPGQLGLEATPEEYVARLVEGFREVRRVLRADGTVWLNLGDSYAAQSAGKAYGWTNGKTSERDAETMAAYKTVGLPPGLKPKDLVGIPWRVAFALQADGWYLRSDIIWSKPNPMPESVTDRPTKAHEYLFLLAKSQRYYFDADAVREGASTGIWPGIGPKHGTTDNHKSDYEPMVANAGRNIRSVWTIATQPYPGAHFATFPEALPERCIKAGCPVGGVVLDPFAGSGTVAVVAERLGRRSVLVELNPDYAQQAMERVAEGRREGTGAPVDLPLPAPSGSLWEAHDEAAERPNDQRG